MPSAENKTKPTKFSVNKFISSIHNETLKKDSKELVKIFEEITKEKATMWGPSIIGFGSYHYKYESGREGDAPRLGFSPRKTNLTLYLVDGVNSYDHFFEKLGKHKTSKACLYINKLEDIDIKVLKRFIREAFKNTNKLYPK